MGSSLTIQLIIQAPAQGLAVDPTHCTMHTCAGNDKKSTEYTWSVGVAFQAGRMTVHRIVCLDLPSEDDVLLLGRNLEGVVVPLPAKEARQDLDEAGVGSHEVVVDQASAMHAHLQPKLRMLTTRVDAPSRGRALALAKNYIPAGNHWGMPCTLLWKDKTCPART